jgi:type IV pilus assembly protein PilW
MKISVWPNRRAVTRARSGGFTILELLIAMTLGLLLMTAVISVFVGSLRTYRTADAMSRIQESARITMEVLRQDIRQAGFFGCRNNLRIEDPPGTGALAPGLIRNTLNSSSTEFDFGAAIEGYRWLGGQWSDLVGGAGALNPAAVTVLTPAPATHSDIIAISRADDAGIVVASHNLPAATIFLDGASDIQQFDVLLVSDCTIGAIFQATGANPGNSAGSVVHNTGTVKVGPGNRTTNLGRTFDPSASVFRMIKHYYYVANSADTGRPGLFRNGEELAEDVERMRATFAVDTNNDQQIDGYLAADAVADWNDVVAVRFELVFSSGDETNVVDSPQTFTFYDGTTYTAPDNRMMQMFTLTVGLRNRLI